MTSSKSLHEMNRVLARTMLAIGLCLTSCVWSESYQRGDELESFVPVSGRMQIRCTASTVREAGDDDRLVICV